MGTGPSPTLVPRHTTPILVAMVCTTTMLATVHTAVEAAAEAAAEAAVEAAAEAAVDTMDTMGIPVAELGVVLVGLPLFDARPFQCLFRTSRSQNGWCLLTVAN